MNEQVNGFLTEVSICACKLLKQCFISGVMCSGDYVELQIANVQIFYFSRME